MWLKIKDFDNYEVCDSGKVRSIDRIKTYNYKDKKGTVNHYLTGKVLREKSIRGYKNTCLVNNSGKRKTRQIHRIVLETFNPVENMMCLQVNHINGIKDDNRLENLEWCTSLENTRHAIKLGLWKYKQQDGSKNHMSKLTEESVIEIRNSKLSKKELSYKYSLNIKTIENVLKRKSWKHI